MHTTSRLALQVPDGTDEEESFPAEDAASLAVLDNAALYLSGTLSAKPNATSTVSGTYYYCTDTGALLLCVAGTWVWPQASTELVGAVKQHSAATIPADADGVQRWHIADGSAVSRSMYASYYAQIGTSWGAGDGSSTFNIPDLRGKVIVGAGSGAGLTTRSVAQNGGEETHLLSGTELPSHAHGVNDPGHAHTSAYGSFIMPDSYQNENAGVIQNNQLNNPNNQTPVSFIPYTSAAGTGISIQNAGGSGAHNNLQPFGVTNHIVKIL